MENTRQILRRSIHGFLQNYHCFTSVAAALAFPFSVSILLTHSQAFFPFSSTMLQTTYNRLKTLFDAAGFPPSSQFFNILNQKFSQTITSCIFTLPLSLTFHLLAKASVIQILYQPKSRSSLPFTSIFAIFRPLLVTYTWTSFLIISANATVFSLFVLAFNCAQGFGFTSSNCILFISAAGAVLYSVILANVLVICNLALVMSGIEGSGGYMAILKACVLIRGRASTALFLAVPVNMVFAAIEALFQFRVVRVYVLSKNPMFPIALETMFLSYLYSIFIVLDTIVNCMFYRSCQAGHRIHHHQGEDLQKEKLPVPEEEDFVCLKVQNFEEFPQ